VHAVYIAERNHDQGVHGDGRPGRHHLSGPASAVVDGNLVTKNSGRGIHIDKGSIVRILNTTVSRAAASGSTLRRLLRLHRGFHSAGAGVAPNTVRNNGGPASTSNGPRRVDRGNTISNNKESGIVVHRNSQADVIAT